MSTRAQGDPNAICCVEQARQKMSPEEFDMEFPNVGPCANAQLNSKKFKQEQSKRKIYQQHQDSTASDPDGKIVHTRSGTSLIYSCKNHDNYVTRLGAGTERFLQYIRPELRDGESSKVANRFKERESRDAVKEVNQTSRLTKDKKKRRVQRSKNKINLFSPGDESDQDFSTEPIEDNGTTYLQHEEAAPKVDVAPRTKSNWDDIIVPDEDEDEDEKPISLDKLPKAPKETPMPTPAQEPVQTNKSSWDDLDIPDEED